MKKNIYEEEHRQAEEAREELKKFLNTLPGKGFTTYQLSIIGSSASGMVADMIHKDNLRRVIHQDQNDLPQSPSEFCVNGHDIL